MIGRTNDSRTNDGRTNDGRTNDSAPEDGYMALNTYMYSSKIQKN